MRTPMSVAAGVTLGDSEFGASVCYGVTRIDELISSELAQSEEIIRDALRPPQHAEGTRLRPLFTVLAAQFGPDPNTWQVAVAGAAIELMHLATLCHDDVRDESTVRSAASSTTTRWNNNIAILVGDYRFAIASRLGSRLGTRAFGIIAETFAELITGQMRETRGTADEVDLLEHYLQCVGEKSGSLVAASAQLGATFSGASEEQAVRLSRLGRLVGTAFHISDDIVAIAGNSDQPDTSLGSPNNNLAEVVTLLRSAAGMVKAKEMVHSYAAQARDEIACLPDCAARQAVLALVDATVSRH
ncbi:polyprenyl synthetase family protein [Mycobacterium simulans]|uniref:polyprenyl synthetase family protein n=1 Tax=Mycobacterium simulans TaxID=627089 RepID=UPI001CD497B7|nr:polyprenyl synthetase family protein [Mycobacterium simulans]